MRMIFVLVFTLLGNAAISESYAKENITSAGFIMRGCEVMAYESDDKVALSHVTADTERKMWLCAGALEATVQMMLLHKEYCPSKTNDDNIAHFRVVTEYMRSHPEQLDQGVSFVMFRALQDKWHCLKTKKQD